MTQVVEATLCYLEREGRLLMIKRDKRPDDLHFGKHNGLGGKLEAGEAPLDCARREIAEECGLIAGRLRFAGHITFPRFDGSRDWSVFLFHGTELAGEQGPDPPEGHLVWVPRPELLDLDLWEGDRHFLPWLLAGRRFLARFDYEEGRYLGHEVCFLEEGPA
ncbi:MAG: 8-oxo-dGTP diphosphatase [bacterium]|jgi:8-oxo-dGTP diphosphatase|nr:8-oxo-dGTP diphosphatase [bacterium]